MVLVASASIVACGDLEQAAGGPIGSDESSGSSADATSTTGGSPDDATHGSGDGATSVLTTGVPTDESGTSAGLDDTATGDATGDPSGSTDDGAPPLPGPNDGAYAGTVTAQFTVDGQNGACQGPLSVVVDELGAPQITGSGSCSTMIGPYPFDVAMTVDGSVASPSGNGTLYTVINFQNESTPWTGSFAGDVLTATFAGDFQQGPYTVTYTGAWSVTR